MLVENSSAHIIMMVQNLPKCQQPYHRIISILVSWHGSLQTKVKNRRTILSSKLKMTTQAKSKDGDSSSPRSGFLTRPRMDQHTLMTLEISRTSMASMIPILFPARCSTLSSMSCSFHRHSRVWAYPSSPS